MARDRASLLTVSPVLPRPAVASARQEVCGMCDSSRGSGCQWCSTSWGDPRLFIACPRGTVKQLHCPAAPRERQNGARRAVGVVIGNLDTPSPSRKRIPRLGTDLQNRAIISWQCEDRTCPRSTLAPPGPVLHTRAGPAGPELPASPGPIQSILRVRKLRLPPVTARVVGWFAQGCRLFS